MYTKEKVKNAYPSSRAAETTYVSCEPTGGISDNERKVNPITYQEAGEMRVEYGQACLPERTLDCDGAE